jgi:hypothetical protein
MKIILYQIEQLQVLHWNKASLLISIKKTNLLQGDTQHAFCTKNVFNNITKQLLNSQSIECYLVDKKYNSENLQWVALPSIF